MFLIWPCGLLPWLSLSFSLVLTRSLMFPPLAVAISYNILAVSVTSSLQCTVGQNRVRQYDMTAWPPYYPTVLSLVYPLSALVVQAGLWQSSSTILLHNSPPHSSLIILFHNHLWNASNESPLILQITNSLWSSSPDKERVTVLCSQFFPKLISS